MPVIDFHLHMFSKGDYTPWVREFTEQTVGLDSDTTVLEYMDPERMRLLLKSQGIDRAVALPEQNPLVSGTCDNDYVAQFCREAGVLIPFASVNPYLAANPAREVERAVSELGCRGLKLYPSYQYYFPNDPKIYPVYAAAERLGIPVMLHTGSSVFPGARMKYADPLYLDDIAVDFPNLTLVQAHSGRGFWYDRAFFLAKLHKNVYMEVSGIPPHRLLSCFPEFERNADKIVFGSDWPSVLDVRGNVDAIRSLPLKERTKEKILGENATRILGL